MLMRLRMAFIMDPMERILVDKDTTFVLMLEAQRREHEIYYLGSGDLFIHGTQPRARCRSWTTRRLRHGLKSRC